MNWKLVANHQIYLHTENWVDRVQDGRLLAIFVCEKWHYLPIFQVSLFSVHNLHTQWIEDLWQIMKSICTQKIGLIRFKMADWRPSLFVKNDTICQFSRFHRFLFIIYIHNELKTCGKSWNLSAHRKLGWPGSRWPTGGHLCLWKMTLFAKFQSFLILCSSFTYTMNRKLVANPEMYQGPTFQ